MPNNRQQLIAAGVDTSILPFTASGSDRFVFSNIFVPLWAVPPDDGGENGGGAAAQKKANPYAAAPSATVAHSPFGGSVLAQKIANAKAAVPSITVAHSPLIDLESQLQQQFGVMFLDRIRITPKGPILGEELLSLSLAPGEEVVIEQQTFSKKETTYEDQNELEQQVDLQFDATLTTGLEEGLDQQRNNTSRTDLGLKADVTIPVDGVNIGVGGSAQNSVTDADTATQKIAVKKSQTSSSKVASKYRSLHKTTLRVSTEQTFQTSSKRTLRNPNRYTPLDMRYFKIYQQTQLCHERYGVRMAWAPCVPTPGAAALARADAAYQKVLDEAVASITLPSKPQPPATLTSSAVVNTNSQTVGSNPFGGGQRTTIKLTAAPPPTPPGGAPYVWDGDVNFINNSLDIQPAGVGGAVSAYVDGLPSTAADGTLTIPVHLGWPGGGQVTASTAANFVPSSNFVSQAMAAYQQALADYNSQVATLTAQAIAGAEANAQAAKDAVLAATDPLQECFRQLITTYINGDGRQACWQFDVWRTIFDWDKAAVTLYPGWWADTVPDDHYPLTSFVNSIEGRVYLPIKPSMEQMAIELLAPIMQLWPDPQSAEAAAQQLLQQVTDYRQQVFGDGVETPITPGADGACPVVTDPFVCIATWTELLPTEGTHLEVVQASTAAEDDLNQAQLADASTLRGAQVQGIQATTTLNQALDAGVQAGTASVTLKLVEGTALNNNGNQVIASSAT